MKQDLGQAAIWYRKAAEQNQPESCFRLAKILAAAPGNEGEVERLLRTAAKGKDPRALYELAMLQLRLEPKLRNDRLFRAVAQFPSERWMPQYANLTLLDSDPVKDLPTILKSGSIMGCDSCGAMIGLIFDKGVGGAKRDRLEADKGYAAFWATLNDQQRFKIERIVGKRFQAVAERVKAGVFPRRLFLELAYCGTGRTYFVTLKPFLD